MTFNPETTIRLVADSFEQIRRCDLFRLLDSVDNWPDRLKLQKALHEARPDLTDDVFDVLEEIADEEIASND